MMRIPEGTKFGGIRKTSDRLPLLFRLAGLCLAILTLAGSVGCSQNRIAEGPPLQVHRHLGDYRFTYNSPAKMRVWSWTGSLHPDFEATLERHPAALQQARSAIPARIAGEVLGIGFLAYGIKMAAFSWEQHPTLPGLNEWTVSGTDWAIFGGLLVGSAVFNRMSESRLERAVTLFNSQETASAEHRDRSGSFLSQLRFSPVYRPGDRSVGVLTRLPVP